jgi:hypothetical protein
MERLDRRRFIRQAAFGSGAIPILAAGGLLDAQRAVQQNANMNILPVHGRILNMSGGTLALETVEGIRPLSLVGARIWKGGGASAAQLRPGDFVWARGVPMQDGLVVTELWANIVNVSGRVDTVLSSTTFVMRWGPFGIVSDSARKTTVTMDVRTIFNDGSPASRERLMSGKPVQVVGTALDESSLHATRVFV